MPAVSKAQQRFMGMVYAAKKGKIKSPSPEVAQAASSMKQKDAKDFASTKHKGLPEKKVAKEAKDFSQRDKIMKKAKPLHKHLYSRLHKKDTSGDVNEIYSTTSSGRAEKYDRDDEEKKKFAKADQKMKYGKRWKEFAKDAESAKSRLRPGEVKKFNKETGKYESNKD